MSTDIRPHSKILPLNSEDNSVLSSGTTHSTSTLEENDKVVTYGELQTQIQTPSPNGTAVGEGFDGSNIDLQKSPFPINNDLFEGLIHVLMRDLPGNTYDFDGEKGVLWEIQIQVSGIMET